MDTQALKERIPTSPAFVVDEDKVVKALKVLAKLRNESGCKLLYSIKALPLSSVLELTKPYVDGFSVSSLFEARLANEILAGNGGIHLTTPGIRPDEIAELTSLCSHISCNSFGQYRQIDGIALANTSIGLRVNPKISFTNDIRHDPCREHSKLGVDLNELTQSDSLGKLKGLHFHTVYTAKEYVPLRQTIDKLRRLFGDKLAGLDWLNLGGGYLFDQIEDNSELIKRVIELKKEYDLVVYIEPGNTIVGKAGYLLATVIDCFTSDGKAIAVLDSSVNHHPQLFEYQRQPELAEHDADGLYPIILAGSTCLAGDIFGEYRFNQILEVGDKLIFTNVGAYSLVKANRFNGYNLPDVYLANSEQIRCIKQHTYHDYRQQWISDT
jgi:carboxynorspermidine decarboxylase